MARTCFGRLTVGHGTLIIGILHIVSIFVIKLWLQLELAKGIYYYPANNNNKTTIIT